LSLTTAPYCQGTQVGFVVVLSVGQTIDSQAYSFTPVQLQTMMLAAQQSMLYGYRVSAVGHASLSTTYVTTLAFKALYN
jgi:hypothetical protein